jgi:hypothetical protein
MARGLGRALRLSAAALGLTRLPSRCEALQATSNLWGAMVDLQLPGKDVDQRVMSCFMGLGMKTCTYDEAAAQSALGGGGGGGSSGAFEDMSGQFDDFSTDVQFPGNELYCIQCCNQRRLDWAVDQTVAAKCDMTDPFQTYNGRSMSLDTVRSTSWEFRFAMRTTTTDASVVTCPLQRTDPSLYVLGYKLTLWVKEYNQVIAYWRGVNKCEAVAVETNNTVMVASNVFREEVRMILTSAAGRASAKLATALLLVALWLP